MRKWNKSIRKSEIAVKAEQNVAWPGEFYPRKKDSVDRMEMFSLIHRKFTRRLKEKPYLERNGDVLNNNCTYIQFVRKVGTLPERW